MTAFARQIYESLLPADARHLFYKMRHMQEYKGLRTTVYKSPKGDFSLKPFDEHKCIFVHITKTAGTSVATSLFGYLPYHYTARDYRIIYGRKTFNEYFKFAFVRNPWDRAYSAYRYLKAGGWNEDDKTWSRDNLGEFKSFDTFVKTWLTETNIKLHKHFWPQCEFICDKQNKILIDYLAYFETINKDFDRISSILGLDSQLGHYNECSKDDYRGAYDQTSREIVAEVYATDIELFGYAFDEIRERTVIHKTGTSR